MKWFPLTMGGLITLLGLYFFVNPAVVLAMVTWLFGFVTLSLGISLLMSYFASAHRHILQLGQAILSILFGLILFFSSTWAASSVAVTILAYWLLFSALLQFSHAYQLRKAGVSGNVRVSTAVLALIFALLLFSAPFFSAAVIGRFVAVLVIMLGVSILSFFFRI